MKKGLFILFFLTGLCSAVAAQPPGFGAARILPYPAVDGAEDNLGNLYLITPRDQLIKLNEAGDSVASYNLVRRFGKLHAIDVTNPLKILLFYKDFSTVVILDRVLSVRATLDLRRQNILQAGAIGLSYDNNIWVYDALENKLKKVDENGTLLLQTPDFRTVFEKGLNPHQIIDKDNSVYLYDSTAGLMIFDYYGTFRKRLPLTGWKALRIADRLVFGISGRALHAYNPVTHVQERAPFPDNLNSFHQYILGPQRLIGLGKDSLLIYSYK
ncbi:MAG TPA: hypothetical protein VHK69_08805 [Chitinophagaceae bacterium]|nr:hypothetical protein [Chitinophagaceae bacterium]